MSQDYQAVESSPAVGLASPPALTQADQDLLVAHELNQPLAAIANFAHGALLRMEAQRGSDPAVRWALEQIADQAKRGGLIIRHMRQLFHKQPSCLKPMDLGTLVRGVAVMLEPEACQRQVRVQLDLEPDLPASMGDAIQIEQVMVNLLRNAFDALSQASPEQRQVIVRTRRTGADLNRVEVQDGGQGISPQQAQRIFDPFFTTRPQGMGMGLAIARSLIESHNGRLWMETNTAAGARFCFELPAVCPEDEGNPL